MQPKTKVKLDAEAFNRLKKTIKNMSLSSARRKQNSTYAAALPEEIGLQLTNRCNLRCKHCFQWNNEGFFHSMDTLSQKDEIDFEVIKRIFHDTSEVKSNLYLWGGEPLSYSRWDDLTKLLETDPRWSVVCTNGIDIPKKMDTILPVSDQMAMLISVEGFEEANDSIRGKGTFRKVMESIDLLLDLQKKGHYNGKISVNTVLNDTNVEHLYDLAAYFEAKKIDTFYISFIWYIPEESACAMDGFYNETFSWLKKGQNAGKNSWHSYGYHLHPDKIQIVKNQINKILNRQWNIRVRFQPPLKEEELTDFLMGKEILAGKKNECLSISSRMDVLSNGTVSSCKLFPEFVVGDLNSQSLTEVWQGDTFKKVREEFAKGLTPVCSKCVLLYLHGK